MLSQRISMSPDAESRGRHQVPIVNRQRRGKRDLDPLFRHGADVHRRHAPRALIALDGLIWIEDRDRSCGPILMARS